MTTDKDGEVLRSPGPSWDDLLDLDSRSVPPRFREQAPYLGSDDDIPAERYTARRWHDLEKRYLWRKVWQYACRAEQLPDDGSYIVYDIADDSYLIVRTPSGEIRAFVNACLHRGRQLKTYEGRCSEIRCPFHGFAWNLDGTFKDAPAEWDFPHLVERVKDGQFSLPEAKVGVWSGFVFINPDPGAEPLEEFLGDLTQEFERWDLEGRYLQAHVAKVVRCNWKIAQEAFSEAYHVNATHPQSSAYIGDTNSRVDVFDRWARHVTPSGTPSPLLAWEPTEEDVLRAMLDVREGEPLPVTLDGERSARDVMAAAARDRWRPVIGPEVDEWSDAELLEHFNYVIFPNFHPWGALNRIMYRFRPNGDDHLSCIFEIMFLAPFSGERPPPAEVQWLGPDDSWLTASGLDSFAMVAEQDTFNMEAVQRGLTFTRKPGVSLSRYQEAIVRWRHDVLVEYLRAGLTADGLDPSEVI